MMTIRIAFLLLLALSLAGCDLRQRFASPEDRINAAMPLELSLRQARERTIEQFGKPSTDLGEFDKAWAARLRARALTCSPNFSPTWRQSSQAVQEAVKDTGCFEAFDRGLQRWMGMQRARWLLAQPPLSSDSVPASVNPRGSLSSDAHELIPSPVVPLMSSAGFELFALGSGRSLLAEPSRPRGVTVSPNGRLFAEVVDGAVRVRVSEGGEVLFDLPDANAVYWLGTEHLGVRNAKGDPSHLLSLRSDKATPILVRGGPPSYGMLPLPHEPNAFAVVSPYGLFKFVWSDANGQPVIKLVKERPMDAIALMALTSIEQVGARLSTDGQHLVMAVAGKFQRIDLQSLDVDHFSLEQLEVSRVVPTAENHQFVLSLSMSGANSQNGNYLFDAKQGTLARVQGAAAQAVIRYVPALRRLVFGGPPSLWLAERLETGTPRPVAEVAASFFQEVNTSILAAAAEQERLASQESAVSTESPIFPLVQGSYVEGVGVYEAREKIAQPGQNRSTGRVVVNVRRSQKPMVLVLSSYEPVQWELKVEPGARLNLVLLGGYYDSTVQGIGRTRVIQLGRVFAYKQEGSEFAALQREVARWAGRPISVFQGAYAGSSYTVGGN